MYRPPGSSISYECHVGHVLPTRRTLKLVVHRLAAPIRFPTESDRTGMCNAAGEACRRLFGFHNDIGSTGP